MKSDPNAPQTTPGGTRPPDSPRTNDPAHQQVQSVHDKYFQDIAQAKTAMDQRFQAVQTEFERATEKACQVQDPNLVQSAMAEYQRAFQAACADTAPIQQCSDAYRNYKLGMQRAIAGANVDDLNFTDIAHICQSLYAVMWTAMSLTPVGPPLSAPPPPPPK